MAQIAIEVRHPDFAKIHSAFLTHYSKDPKLGEQRYTQWLSALGLDDSKPYCKPQERFQWAKNLIEQVKEDPEARYYKVEALFPLESMNQNLYTREELLQATRTLTGKPSNLNHQSDQKLPEIEIIAAQCEDDVAECFVRIQKTSKIPDMIERKQIVNVSVEADWSHSRVGKGLVFEGLGWLTTDVLPGVPLTRIEPVEKIAESFTQQTLKPQDFQNLPLELIQSKANLDNLENNTKTLHSSLNDTSRQLAEANQTITKLKEQLLIKSLLKSEPKTLPILEHIKILESLLPAPMVENSTLGMQRECQIIRAAIYQAKQKLERP
jgi:hypothetical protein